MLLVALAAIAWASSASATANAARRAAKTEQAGSFAFRPVTMQRINLPSSVTSAAFPEFTVDGRHLLFWFDSDLWLTSLHGAGTRCLTCGIKNDPDLPDAAYLATPFPDGKRVFIDEDLQPPTSKMAVLQCTPSIVDCDSATIEPVDFSSAEPVLLPPGGAVQTPQETLVGGAYHAKLSQDGNYIGFSELRSDAIEAMVVARLVPDGSTYAVADPRVINPPAPTSSSDPNPEHWSESSGLFEFKTFTDGGADATYVEVGGTALMAPQVWSVNLATGQRTRLTADADWNEDNGVSPNGKLLSVYSQQTMNYVDWVGGMMPVEDFIDGPASTFASAAFGGNAECMGTMWLMPSSGDDDARLAGEPLVDYRYPHVHVVRSYTGSSQWSPNGTMVALDTVDDTTGNAPPYLLVAHLNEVKPTRPLPAVSSEPGSWAPSPSDYHGAIAHDGTVVLHGARGGTVTVDYDGTPGAFAGSWSETYDRYSTDGRDFVTGTVTITGTALAGHYTSHLVMTGADTGSDNANLTISTEGTQGSAVDSYDGNTITGPFPGEQGPEAKGGPQSACPSHYPKEPKLRLVLIRTAHRRDTVRVTASVAHVGLNEALTDVQPVADARITVGDRHVLTNTKGIAMIAIRGRHRHPLARVTAGDTLVSTSAHL